MRRRLLLALGVTLGLVGAVAPWIPHQTAGLNVGGFFLFEAGKLLPPIRNGTVSLFREGFLLPLLASAVLLATLPAFAPRPSRLVRVFCPLVAAGIALAAMPPYPAILSAHRDPEYRGQLLLAAIALFLIGTSPLLRRVAISVRKWLAAAIIIGAASPAWIALLRVQPLFAQLYDAPVGIGWGAWVYAAGCVVALVALLLIDFKAAPETL